MDLAMVYEDYDWVDEQTQVSIYTDDTIEETVTFPTDKFADEYFGGFENSFFYDYLKLFSIIILIVFAIKILSLLFNSK